jgi:hypothetical protein
MNIININIIGGNYDVFNTNNNTVTITKYNFYEIVTFSQEYKIKFNIDSNINYKKYYIEVNLDPFDLNTANFDLTLEQELRYEFLFYNGETSKSLVIYRLKQFIPLIYLGLPNFKEKQNIEIVYNYYSIDENDPEGFTEQNLVLYNNYEGNYNYLLNSLQINGNIYKLKLLNNSIFNETLQKFLYLFKIKTELYLNINTNIYFYDISHLSSYLIYLNNYNYTEFKNFPEKYDNIIVLIEYSTNGTYNDYSGNIVDCSGGYFDCSGNFIDCSGNCNRYFDYFSDCSGYLLDCSGYLSDCSGCANDISGNDYYIYSLNLQTFNSIDTADTSGNKYFNTLFFYNYIDPNYTVKSISIFGYDYDKYFVNMVPSYPLQPIETQNIGSYNNQLYCKIIENDINLSKPIILDLNYQLLFLNLNLLNLIKMINLSENNNFIKLTQSQNFNIQTVIDYFDTFIIKEYNIFKIKNIFTRDNYLKNNVESTDKIQIVNGYNFNYIYNNEKIVFLNYLNDYSIETINFNNNIMNSIRCKIVFLFWNYTTYSFDGKLFLDNYNIQIYHKKYCFNNETGNENKKKLINMLLFLALGSFGIKIIFYNNKNSEPKASSTYNNFLTTNDYYLFNEINLSRKSSDFNIIFDSTIANNTNQSSFLNFNITISKNYYILFLKTEKCNFLTKFKDLVFTYAQYTFKIFKLDKPNGSINKNEDLFYISFQNLKELNIFLIYLKTGVFNTNPKTLSNYFNIPESVLFCNYYNINNFWVLNSVPPPAVPYNNPSVLNKYKIIFSINNLNINQIYLYGELFIKPICI